MKTIFEHIEHARKKPHHVRKRIAFAAAAACSAFIALVWLVGSFSLGAFAIKGSTFADSTGQSPIVTVAENEVRSANGGIAGAAAALPDTNAPAHITIIDTTASTSAKNTAEQTTIPF